ncbi:type II secretion system F family protein [Nocardia arthritidis]|uniref:Type II secretion system protein GspF domain-containing protein n=1 Tax=Nocardia arthritidis TaxID=228602 RepID=A0A6G9Y547_9NOCA|nr:hypothetical protein [Nocardia arthritidis]QIS08321.1 hypothetical protein F5544_02000 [Nocardia arthritidis]
MSMALGCLAIALLVAPASGARRRFARVFGVAQTGRKTKRGTLIRAGVAVAVLATAGFGAGTVIAAVMVTATIGVRMRRSGWDRRRDRECARLLDALECVVAELRVGAHPSAAADVAASESQGEAAQAFSVSAARGRLGGSAADGLLLPESVVAAELSRIAGAWRVAEQHGLALAELLAAARADLVGRIRFRARTNAALAGARASAAVLAGLPLLGITLGQLMGAAPLHVLFTTAAGTLLLPLGSALACCGLIWTDAITRKVLL